jgi:hypothetical protein
LFRIETLCDSRIPVRIAVELWRALELVLGDGGAIAKGRVITGRSRGRIPNTSDVGIFGAD